MAKVFIPQEPSRKSGKLWVPKYDLSPAREYGELVSLSLPGLVGTRAIERLQGAFQEKLRDFGDNDSILAVGDPLLIGLAFHYAAVSHLSEGVVHVLRFHRREGRYERHAVMV